VSRNGFKCGKISIKIGFEEDDENERMPFEKEAWYMKPLCANEFWDMIRWRQVQVDMMKME